MKKYYLHNESDQQGPFDIEELKIKKISKDTPIWYEGISEWTTAGKVDELKDLFNVIVPPPFEAKTPTPPPVQKQSIPQTNNIAQPIVKKNNTTRTILIIIGAGVLATIGLLFFNSMGSSSSSYETTSATESYQEKVMTVEEIERSQPTNFLTADGNYNENFWGDKIKVHGVIKNTATVASYKDAVVKVTYYSKTKTILGSNNYTIYDNFTPNSETKFELKIENYKDVNSIGWDVIEATAN